MSCLCREGAGAGTCGPLGARCQGFPGDRNGKGAPVGYIYKLLIAGQHPSRADWKGGLCAGMACSESGSCGFGIESRRLITTGTKAGGNKGPVDSQNLSSGSLAWEELINSLYSQLHSFTYLKERLGRARIGNPTLNDPRGRCLRGQETDSPIGTRPSRGHSLAFWFVEITGNSNA